jgi:uncharacterized protein (DUF58 family)
MERSAAKRGRRLPLPGRRLLGALLVSGLLALLVPLLPPLATVWLALVILIVLLALLDLACRPRAGAVTVRREIEPLYFVGRESRYRLLVANESAAGLEVEVRDVLPPALEGDGARFRRFLAPGEEAAIDVDFVGLERGEQALPGVGLRLSRPYGLLEHQVLVPLADRVLVAPGRPSGETEALLSRAAVIEEAGERTMRRRGSEREFESLREYVTGDEVRRIDWKASARRHRPQVRQYQSERNSEVVLALDCGRLMGGLVAGIRKLDLAMTPVLDLAAVALRRRERVGLLAFDSRPRAFLPPRPGLAQLNAMIAAMARLPRGAEASSFLRAVRHLDAHHRKRSLILFFSDFTDELSAQEMYASFEALSRRHILIFVAVGDPHLEEVFAYSGRDTRGLLEKSVAGQLLIERRRTLARLERLGVYTVDAEPSRLSGPLIGRYLEVRLRGVI